MILKISGMTCGHCVSAVEKALTEVPGVTAVKDISIKDGIAHIEGTPDPQQLIAAVIDEGYTAKLIDG